MKEKLSSLHFIMRKSVFLKIACFSFFISCSQPESLIYRKIDKHCNDTPPCSIEMKQIVPGDWDTMFFFKQVVSYREINEILGFKYPYYEDVASRIVFVKNGRVIYHEDAYPNVSADYDDRLFFKISDSINYKVYDRKNAVFRVNMYFYETGTIIELFE